MRGKYPLADCTRAYIRWLKDQIDGRTDTSTELGQARLAKERLEVQRRKPELARIRREVVPVSFMVEEFDDALRRIRAGSTTSHRVTVRTCGPIIREPTRNSTHFSP